ncbi:hypothetical protein MA16_Dca013127 [Dendrobium catenatum]|uniref:Uncharacterized protein n=1 Tax=Dendrobium catenatum TaxID=906689 RepID=A0A2I0WD63_9ASPA|nr:hypothetical protein MA16_Dca013127 [Dendrobium catenatum]
MGIWDAIANAAASIKGFLPGFTFSSVLNNTWKLLKGRLRGLLVRLGKAKEAMGIWDAMAKAAGGIKGSDLFLKMKILFSSVLNNIRAAVSDLVKIAGNTWKLLKDLRGLLLRLRKAKKAMGIWGAMDNTEGDIKGYLLGLFLKVLFSSILSNYLDSVSDPDIKNRSPLPHGNFSIIF